LEGYIIDLLGELSRNSTIEFETARPVEDGQYGKLIAGTNNWDGLIGELKNNVSKSPILFETFRF